MSTDALPREVVDAVRAWGEAMIAGPEKCTCKGHPGWNGEEEHSDNCQWVRAGVIEHFAGNTARRAIRAWAVAEAASSPVLNNRTAAEEMLVDMRGDDGEGIP